FQYALQAYLASIPIASMSAMRKGMLEFGPANTTVLLFEDLMDSQALWLTPNTTSIYMGTWLELTDEPMVIETPPDVLGFINDFWFRYVVDFGNTGADLGEGGKFLIVPPGYEGDLPENENYYIARTNTYGNWVLWRGFQVDGDTAPAVKTTKEIFRMYPLSQKNNPPQMNFKNISGVLNNTIHRMDYGIWEEVNEVVQAEPSEGMDAEILGLLTAIGIKKGQPFDPDERMKGILTEAADVGAVTARALAARPRDDDSFLYPGERYWMTPFVGDSYEFLDNGARLLNARTFFHFYATGITPAMSNKKVGEGSKYACAYLDADGNLLDGSKTYKIHLPPEVPADDFWSFTIYDNQTRAMLQTDYQFPGIDSNKDGLSPNSDGSYDIYFGPEAPQGKENYWIQTDPGSPDNPKGFNIIFRVYGPSLAWFSKTWKPGDPELVS
ncbi:MAG: DUF1254 domain-containing protein, partial [Xenococcus sp. (in: cyanobacteria)]